MRATGLGPSALLVQPAEFIPHPAEVALYIPPLVGVRHVCLQEHLGRIQRLAHSTHHDYAPAADEVDERQPGLVLHIEQVTQAFPENMASHFLFDADRLRLMLKHGYCFLHLLPVWTTDS